MITWLVVKIVKKKVFGMIRRFTSKTGTISDDLLLEAAEKFVIPFIYLFVSYTLIVQLNLADRLRNILQYAILFVATYYAVRLTNFIIHGAVLLWMEKKNEPPERIKQVNGMLILVKVMVWGTGLLVLVNNLGFDITAVIAGFGVGGIAIALAAQNILGDLFSYFVIFFDKPFEVGDFIKMGDNAGVVERIGIKTSHVRSLSGQQLVMPNAELVNSVIENFKRLQRRRIVFAIGVVYYTPAEKLRRIPALVQKLIDVSEDTTFDRAHFKEFGDFSINYEIVYYIESAEYNLYMDRHHAICMNMFEVFEKEGIEFAYPTQTVFVNHQNNDNKVEKADQNGKEHVLADRR
jgi:small-conductance mechanosensitive channel